VTLRGVKPEAAGVRNTAAGLTLSVGRVDHDCAMWCHNAAY